MKIDILGMEAFVALADMGSFAHAAQALSITQTAVSRRLQNFESYLGIALVERTTRTVVLTAAGRDFLPLARVSLGDLADLFAQMQAAAHASEAVSVACIPSLGVRFVAGALDDFGRLHPGVAVRVVDSAGEELVAAVRTGRADLGVTSSVALQPGVAAEPLWRDEFVAVCAAGHRLAGPDHLGWSALYGHRLILPGPTGVNEKYIRPVLESCRSEDARCLEVLRSSTALGMAAQGLGVAIVPRSAFDPASQPALRLIVLTQPQVWRQVVLLTRDDAALSPAAARFADVLRGRARAMETSLAREPA